MLNNNSKSADRNIAEVATRQGEVKGKALMQMPIWDSPMKNTGIVVSNREEFESFMKENEGKMKSVRSVLQSDASDEVKRKAKAQLPCMMPAANLPTLSVKKTKEIARKHLNGHVFCDFDHIHVSDDVRRLVALHPDVLMAKVSISGEGLHVVLRQAQHDTMKQAHEFAHYLHLTLDEACKNENRLMYLSPREDWFVLKDEFFTETEAPQFAEPQATQAEPPQYTTTTTWTDESMNLVNLIENLYQAIGKPLAGVNNKRNSKTVQVALWFWDAVKYGRLKVSLKDAVSIFRAQFHFGDPDHIEGIVRWAFKCKRTPYMPLVVRNVLGLNKLNELMSMDEAEYWAGRLAEIDLPRGLRECVMAVEPSKRMAALISVLPAWQTVGTGIRYKDYFEQKWRRFGCITFIINSMGGGKQQLFELAELVVLPLRQADKSAYAQVNEFKEEFVENGGKAPKGKKTPKVPIRVIGSMFSGNRILTRLANAVRIVVSPFTGTEFTQHEHLLSMESDASYSSAEARKTFTYMGYHMLKSFNNERVNVDYKEETSVSGPMNDHTNWLYALNRNDFMNFIHDMGLEKGLASRISPALFPFVEGGERPKPMSEEDKATITDMARRLTKVAVWVEAEEITEPLNKRLRELEAQSMGDYIKGNATHRPYNQIGPSAGVLSAVMRSIDEVEQTGKVSVTEDDTKLAMLVADYVYEQFLKMFYAALVREAERGNKIEGRTDVRRTIDIPANSEKVSESRLKSLPLEFSAAEGITLTGMERDKFLRWCRDQVKRGNLAKAGEWTWRKV